MLTISIIEESEYDLRFWRIGTDGVPDHNTVYLAYSTGG